MKDIQKTIKSILDTSKNLYDRQDVCKMIILALIADESIFLYGPPGTAKSMVAKWAASVLNTEKYFSCLLNQYTQPDELFGPVSIKALEEGRRELMTEGYMPEAEITFLDEIWKAGPAILNTLLTICNEKKFKNGNKTMEVPLKLLLSASNEFPEEESGLGALYDRFLIRMEVNPICNKKDFHRLMTEISENLPSDFEPLSNEDLNVWKDEAKAVGIPEGIFNFIYILRSELKKNEIYISDRRWKKIVKLMKCSAFLNGRNEIDVSDFFILDYTLWSKLEDKEVISECIKIVFSDCGINIREKEFAKKIEQKIAELEKEITTTESSSNASKIEQKLDDLQKEINSLPKVIREYSRSKFENQLKPKSSYIERAANTEIGKQISEYISEKNDYLDNLIYEISNQPDVNNLIETSLNSVENTTFPIKRDYMPFHDGWENERIWIKGVGHKLSPGYVYLQEYNLELDRLSHDLPLYFLLKGATPGGGFYCGCESQFIKSDDNFRDLPVPARVNQFFSKLMCDDEKKLRFLDYLLFCNPDSSTAFVLDMQFILFSDEFKAWIEYLNSIDFWRLAYGKDSK